MNEYTIPPNADQAQASQALILVQRAIAVVINTDADYGASGAMLHEVRAKAKELTEIETERTRSLNYEIKQIRDSFRIPKQWVKEAEESIERARMQYRNLAEEQRREAERIAEASAQRERERLEREAAAIEEVARKTLEKAAAKARELEEAGKLERAEAARKAAADRSQTSAARAAALRHVKETWPTQPIIHREPPKTRGIYAVTRWSARVIDKMALIQAVASGGAPDTVLEVNQTALNRLAVALKDGLNYPGVLVESKESESVRTQ